MTPFDEQRRELAALLRGALPPERAAFIEARIRDTIAITPRKARKADSAVGASRLGGLPDLPSGSVWPTKTDGQVNFVGQIRLEDLVALDVHHRLPPKGLLSFFHGYLTNGEYDVEARVFWFPDAPAGLSTVELPNRRGRPKPVGIDFAPLAMLPPHSSRLVPRAEPDDPYCELFDEYYKLYEGDFWFHGLLGFDRPMEGEDGQREGEEILLRLDACGVPYDFVEAACAYYFIPRDDLAQCEFSRARLFEGASI